MPFYVGPRKFGPGIPSCPEQFLILITCRDEKQQVEMLERFASEVMERKALVA